MVSLKYCSSLTERLRGLRLYGVWTVRIFKNASENFGFLDFGIPTCTKNLPNHCEIIKENVRRKKK